MGDKKNKQKELVGISFNRSVPRQKRVYDFLVQEKLEKGTTYSAIVHDALYVYSKYLQYLEANPIFDVGFISRTIPVQTSAIAATAKKAEEAAPEEEVLLTDADMEEEYLQSILLDTYAED